MKNTYPITQEQIDLLSTFTCERLSRDRDNLSKIQTFLSYRGPGLVNTLRNRGWNEDCRGTTAYYVVKNPQGRIMLFFSLKCGVLFDPDYVDRCADEFSETQRLWRTWNQARAGDEAAAEELAQLRRELGKEEYDRRIRDLREEYEHRTAVLRQIKNDKRYEPNKKIVRVDQSHPAVELVEFCVNERLRSYWEERFQQSFATRRQTMGKVLFWWFIVPKMIEVSSLLGCEYAYLFAADDEPDGDLVRYYEDALHFRKLTHLGAIKPFYDMTCYFMGRRLFSVDEDNVDPHEVIRDDDDLRGLDYYRNQFFSNFNLRTDVDDMI